MSYPDIESENFLEDLTRRKEFYSLKISDDYNFRDPDEGRNDPILGKYLKIHSHQLFVRSFMSPDTPYSRLHLLHGTGCHAIGTKILMHDGTIKNVEDVVVGDRLMGDDSAPRNVLSLIRNIGKMYEVLPEFGPPFICNEGHILVIKCDDNIIEITIKEYLDMIDILGCKSKLYRVAVDFPEQKLEIEPYDFGFAHAEEMLISDSIPYVYRCNSRPNRLKLIAGLIDKIGRYNATDNAYEIVWHEGLIDDVVYLCRSLGFAAYKMSLGTCFYATISGNVDQIPVRICEKSRLSDVDVLSVRFNLRELDDDIYYGFQLDGNRRYLLGCFTVTHNTGKCHARGTKLLLHNGEIKNVEDITIDDKLMGDDSMPRNILSLAHGREIMYELNPIRGESWICNKSHILTVKFDPEHTVDIAIDDFLALDKSIQDRANIFTVGVEFEEIPVEIDPYIIGFNLGHHPQDCRVEHKYKCNSRVNRLKLLAGLIDSSAAYDAQHNMYIFAHEGTNLIDDVLYLCRSLGFAAYKHKMDDVTPSVPSVIIYGTKLNEIPTIIGRKHARNDSRGDYLLTKFTLKKLPEDDYFGFVIDGNRRYLLANFVVTHNTLASISIAQRFIHIYNKMYISLSAKTQAGRRNYAELDRATPTVFVLGFGGVKAAFINELMRHPELGFISISEKEEIIKRQKMAETGLPDDIKHFREFYSMIKKRITNKSRGGFYRFYGYDEFVNRLFLADDVKLTDLEAIAIQKMKAGENITIEDLIYDNIEQGKIQVNQQLLVQFENSLIICDEIHHTYNMNMKNNRGVAIQFIIDTVPTVRLLTLSATPINNSPTEVVELINYLVPKTEKVTKRELFVNNRTLVPGGLEKIGKLTHGRVSFLQDANIKYFPKRIFEGEEIVLPIDVENFTAGSFIPYLKFTKCPMSEYHQKTYSRHLESVEKGTNIDEDTNYIKHEISSHAKYSPDEDIDTEITQEGERSYHNIPTDGYAIYDIVFPNPESDEYGLFRSSEVKNKIGASPQEWKDVNKINVKKFSAMNSVITGEFLARENLSKYSTKYAAIVDQVMAIIANSGGDQSRCQKIMIYHDRVKMSGVLLIQEILRMNNFIDETSEPVDSTLCCICGQSMGQHLKEGEKCNHSFRPARFVMAHSDIDKSIRDQSLSKFNSPDNMHGLNYFILVASRIVKESYNFKDIQHLLVSSLPVNIPTLIQVFGRCVRKNSHINLPPSQRVVHIYIFVSTINESLPVHGAAGVSPEIYRYIDKLSDYIAIQNIEREINRHAIDSDIHRDIIMPPDLYRQYFPEGHDKPVDSIGNLYFDPAFKVGKYKLEELNMSTFISNKYYEDEINMISMIIKRLFILQPVWIYDDLWNRVRRPPFGIEVNPQLFSEDNFIISLHNLVSEMTDIISLSKQRIEMTELHLIEKLFDFNERYIYNHGERFKIHQVGKYYVLFPVVSLPSNPLNVIFAEYLEHIRDKDRALIRELSDPNDKILIDVETYLRPIAKKSGVRINIETFVKESKAGINYIAKRNQFKQDYKNIVILQEMYNFLSDFSSEFQMAFLEESILFMIFGDKAFPQDDKPDEDMRSLYEKVIDLFNKFKIIIYAQEIRKYKDTAKQYKNGVPGDDIPLGYVSSKYIKLFDPMIESFEAKKLENLPYNSRENGRWFEVSKIALNRHTSYQENDIIVGYFESAEDHMKFKLRKPAHLIKADIARDAEVKKLTKSELEGTAARTTMGDTRLIERGIVCSTKNKDELLRIISSLGISVSKLEREDIRIKKLCEIIKVRLIDSEIKERQRDSKWKYIYLWDSETPQLG